MSGTFLYQTPTAAGLLPHTLPAAHLQLRLGLGVAAGQAPGIHQEDPGVLGARRLALALGSVVDKLAKGGPLRWQRCD